MDFDYYFKKYDEEYGFNGSELCGFEIGFEAGQQSKQEDVNKLQKEIDVLKDKINKVLYAISQSELHGDRAIWGIQDEIKEILK